MMNSILKMQLAALTTECSVLRAKNTAQSAEIEAKDRELAALRCYVLSISTDIEYIELKNLVTEHYNVCGPQSNVVLLPSPKG
jgi:hypothetical protein